MSAFASTPSDKPSAKSPSRFRRVLLWLHTWVGLTIGLALLFLAVTGGVLVTRPMFGDVVDHKLLKTPACATPLPLDMLAEEATRAHPQEKLASLEFTADPAASVAVKFANKDYVYLDACSGRVLGVQNQYGGLFGVVDGLHRFRFVENGRAIAGVLNAIVGAVLVVGGLVLWWPRSRAAAKGALTFNARLPGVARTLNLHKVVGVYASALLLCLTVTGLPLGLDWAKNLITVATGSPTELPPPPAAPRHPPHTPRVKMEAVWARIKAEAPNWQWAGVSFPKKGVVSVEYLEPGAPHADAKSHMYLDAATGEVLSLKRYGDGTPLGRKVYLFIIALHSGLVGGIPYQLALVLVCFSVPVQVYSGFSPYIRKRLRGPARLGLALKLIAKRDEAEGVCSFEFADPSGRALPAFSAGSHIEVTIGPGLTRRYSLCNDPKETHRYLIAVLRKADSRGGSQAMHDDLTIGDVIQAGLPKNHFALAHAAERSLLIAGGIGITPILCMAERLSNSGAEFSLHYAMRSRRSGAFVERIQRSEFASRTRLHISDEGSSLDVGDLLRSQDRSTHIYVCGPVSLIDKVVETALGLGWPEALLHSEYFVAETHNAADDRPFDVKIASSGLLVHVAKDDTVTEALARAGIDIPTSCSEGVCGTCLTRVLEGVVEHHDRLLSSQERNRNDQFTPCCSRAAGGLLVLDL